ncbi:MAG: geranylgeranylglycerol-phosphate geranylgeranyltransferase [Chitinophagales bacterium]
MPWLQLIRWHNLLIIFLTQFLVWVCVILPIKPEVLNLVNFCCITLSAMLIAAAGYIINDYFDNKIDAVNKPGKVVLGKTIPRKQAIIYHSVLNAIALLLAGYVAWRAGHYEWLLIQVGCTLLLWYYSVKFKRQLITGNIVVALLTSLTIITLIIYEPGLHRFFNDPVFERTGSGVYQLNRSWLLIGYAIFAFLLTWMREIVKDMEDMKGDSDQGCVTMPIKWGLSAAARFTQVLGIITVICLLTFGIRLLHSDRQIIGYCLLIVVTPPLIIWIITLNRKYTKEHYHNASRKLKIIMVLGLCSLIVNLLLSYLI